MFFVYILYSQSSKKYYIGSTKDIHARVARHNAGKVPSTKSHTPWKLIHTEEFETLSEARLRELKIKSWKNPTYMIRTLNLEPAG
jgi:putative endonuclease